MAEVELILKADNSQYVNKVKEAQKATQELANAGEQTVKRRLGLIEQEEKRISALTELRRKAYDPKNVEFYNKTIQDSTKRLEDYKKAGLEAERQTESLASKFGKWVVGIASAAAILGTLKDAFMKLTYVINVVNIAGAAWNQVLNNIVTGQASWLNGITEAIKTQMVLNNLRVEGYKEDYKVQKLRTEFQRKWSESLNAELSTKEKIVKIDEALLAHNKAIDLQVEHAKKGLMAMYDILLRNPLNEKALKDYWAALSELERLDAERYESTKRLIRQKSTLEKQDHDERIKRWYDEIEEQNKTNEILWEQEKAYQQKIKEIEDKYAQSNIDSLTGKAKLEAQRDFGLEQIKEMRSQLAKLGVVTEEIDEILKKLGVNVWKAYSAGLKKELGTNKLTPEERKAIAEALFEPLNLEGLQKFGGTLPRKGGVPMTSIWQIFGIDPETEEGGKIVTALTEAKDRTISVIDEMYQARVTDTQRNRELLDTQISETQRALELETELYKAGYASNVAAKQKELEELERQRTIALKKEEEAIKKQRQLDTVMQVSSLITASAQTFKAFPGPLLPVAIAVIAAMFAAFAASKIKAGEATKLAEGGSGTVRGKRHSQGGERFLDHVEIEQGEHWGVLSRRAADKYGDIFHDMVSSFNKDQMPEFITPAFSNNIRVDNNGPNKRLDKIYLELEKQNKGREEIMLINNQVVIKKGNNTRIIKK